MSSEKLHPPTPTNYINIFSAWECGCRADEDECDSDITPSLVRVWSAHQPGSHQLIFSTNILKSNKFCFEILSTSLGFESQCFAEGEEDRGPLGGSHSREEKTLWLQVMSGRTRSRPTCCCGSVLCFLPGLDTCLPWMTSPISRFLGING